MASEGGERGFWEKVGEANVSESLDLRSIISQIFYPRPDPRKHPLFFFVSTL